ncbi:MAG: hypothetical protein ACRDST_07865 [Pseudonocardiaceae bacterium]
MQVVDLPDLTDHQVIEQVIALIGVLTAPPTPTGCSATGRKTGNTSAGCGTPSLDLS